MDVQTDILMDIKYGHIDKQTDPNCIVIKNLVQPPFV